MFPISVVIWSVMRVTCFAVHCCDPYPAWVFLWLIWGSLFQILGCYSVYNVHTEYTANMVESKMTEFKMDGRITNVRASIGTWSIWSERMEQLWDRTVCHTVGHYWATKINSPSIQVSMDMKDELLMAEPHCQETKCYASYRANRGHPLVWMIVVLKE